MVELTAMSSRNMVEQLQHFYTFIFYTAVQQGFKTNGKKYYIYFIDNLLLFPTVKEFSKSVNS